MKELSDLRRGYRIALKAHFKADPLALHNLFAEWRKMNRGTADVTETAHNAVYCVASEFRREMLRLPAWALKFVREKIAMPDDPRLYSMTKLKQLDAAIRKAHASLACPVCKLRLSTKALHLHHCGKLAGATLSAQQMIDARMSAGLPIGARLAKSGKVGAK